MLRKTWFGGVFKPKNIHSLEHLRYLYSVLSKNQTVSDSNRGLLVETLRSIAEILIWGDQNDSSVFDFFLEKNMLSFFLRIMKQKCGSYVCVQLLQTLNILFENIRNETSLYYLLSNNHVNSIIVHKFDFSDEEVMAYYISFLKTLSFKLNSHTIHFFYNEHTNDFPLYTEAIKFFNHPESMVRIAVRTLTLNVYRVNDQSMLQFIRDRTAAPYFSNLVWFIGNHILELDACVRDDIDHDSRDRLSALVAEHLDHLHYLNDILRLHITPLNHLLAHQLLHRLLLPLLVHSLLPPDTPRHHLQYSEPISREEVRHQLQDLGSSDSDDISSPIERTSRSSIAPTPRVSKVVALFLLAQVFLILSFPPLVHTLASTLLYAGASLLQHYSNTEKSCNGSKPGFVAPEESLETSLLSVSHGLSTPRRSLENLVAIPHPASEEFSRDRLATPNEEQSSSQEINKVKKAEESQMPERACFGAVEVDTASLNITDEEKQQLLAYQLPQCCILEGGGVAVRPFLQSVLDALDCRENDYTALFGLCLLYAFGHNEGFSEHLLSEAFSTCLGTSHPIKISTLCTKSAINRSSASNSIASIYSLKKDIENDEDVNDGLISDEGKSHSSSVLEWPNKHRKVQRISNDSNGLSQAPLPLQSKSKSSYNSILVEKLLQVITLSAQYNSKVRIVTLELAVKVLRQVVGLELNRKVGKCGSALTVDHSEDQEEVTICFGIDVANNPELSASEQESSYNCRLLPRAAVDTSDTPLRKSSSSTSDITSASAMLTEAQQLQFSDALLSDRSELYCDLNIESQCDHLVSDIAVASKDSVLDAFMCQETATELSESKECVSDIIVERSLQQTHDTEICSKELFPNSTCEHETDLLNSNRTKNVGEEKTTGSLQNIDVDICESSDTEAKRSRTKVSSRRRRPVSGNKAVLSDEHLAVLEGAREEATLVLRNFYKSEEMFLDLFEDEWNCSEGNQGSNESVKVEYLLQDSNMLLPPTATPLTGIPLSKRRPCGEVERARRAMRVFFLVRAACLSMRGETDSHLPLTQTSACVKVDDILDLNNSDLIACVVITKDGERTRRFLVTDVLQVILVEPDQKRLGWGVAKFVGFLQDLEVSGDKDDSRVLHVTLHRRAAGSRNCSRASSTPLLTAKFIFDDHIRCMAAKQRLTKGRNKARQRKLHQIAKLLELPSHLQPCPSPPSHALSAMRQEAQHRRGAGALRSSSERSSSSSHRHSSRFSASSRAPGRATPQHNSGFAAGDDCDRRHCSGRHNHHHRNAESNTVEEIQLDDIGSSQEIIHPTLRRL